MLCGFSWRQWRQFCKSGKKPDDIATTHAGPRYPNEDVYVFASKSEEETLFRLEEIGRCPLARRRQSRCRE
jgi:hypothetical protein